MLTRIWSQQEIAHLGVNVDQKSEQHFIGPLITLKIRFKPEREATCQSAVPNHNILFSF